MLYEEKKLTLKDGRCAILKSPEESMAAEMLAYLKTTSGETPFLLRTPEECTMTLQQEEAFLENVRQLEYDVMMVCIVEGKLAGNCRIVRKNKRKNRHRGTVMIALLKEFWDLGIGSAMFREMIAIAREWGLIQLELEVIEGNDRAMALYRKFGFETVAATPNAIRLPDGTLLKEYLMVKPLQENPLPDCGSIHAGKKA